MALRQAADDGRLEWPRVAPKAESVPSANTASQANTAPRANDVVIDLRDSAPVIELPEPKPSYRNLDPDHFQSLMDGCDGVNRRLTRTRVFDIVAGSALLLAALPVIAVSAALVRLTSRGPAFYASERFGHRNSRFGAWKLRTMVGEEEQRRILEANPEVAEQLIRNCKLADDPRVTRVGRILRRTSLDELPQLWNIVLGEMSLVGPRPKTMEEGPRYGPALDVILSVRPGLTGLWQVSGRNDLPFEDRIVLDLEYLATRSVAGDIRLCIITARQFVSSAHHGAY